MNIKEYFDNKKVPETFRLMENQALSFDENEFFIRKEFTLIEKS